MRVETVEADVLCVGGGIAGLMAAIRASELGAKVVVAEKANTLRSGAGATGNDHFRCYIPEFHGSDIKPIIEMAMQTPIYKTRSMNFVHTWLEKTFDIVKLWDSWGIPMKHNGKWEFSGHARPGGTFPSLKYEGQNQKPVLTKEALSRGVQAVNRVMVFDLLMNDGSVAGAIGIGTRENKLTVFLAKSVVLGTGRCVRLYPSPTPGWMFNRAESPADTGDGRAMAWRAGAELRNMELPMRWAGPKYFSRCGKGTWAAVVRGPDDKPIGPFLTKPDKRYGDLIADIYHSLFEDYMRTGKGPVYMDCRGISDEDYQYMLWGLSNEGNLGLINYLETDGIDLRKNAVEFMTYELTPRGGLKFNEKAETSMKGLYAAGDEYFGGISGAATFGWIAGDNAAKYAGKSEIQGISDLNMEIEVKRDLLNEICGRETGASWQEVNITLNQIMQDYAGHVLSKSLLDAGLTHLQRLKQKAYSTMTAKNQHELLHCLEMLNLLDMGEIVFVTTLERKESRGEYQRVDFPYTNPMLNNKELVCKKADKKIVTEWKALTS